MARLFHAKDFFPGYSRLERRVQNSVVAAIGKLSEHTRAGLHLEQLTESGQERCLLFVACTQARDHLEVSHTGQPSPSLAA